MPKGPLVGRALLQLTNRLRDSRVLDILGEIESEPRASRQQIRARQFARLSYILAAAEAHVPYYRELFRSLGIRSRDIRTFDDFSRLPVLTKDIVRERQRDLINETVPATDLIKHNSGGSTGVPLSFLHDRRYLDASEAGTFRNLQQCGWRPGEMYAFFWGCTDRHNRMSRFEWALRQWMRRHYQFDPFRSGPADMDQWLRVWRRIRPRAAVGYASTVGRFATHLETTGQTVAPLRGVITTGEKLYPPQRAAIQRVFQCPVFDCYGSSEVRNLAAECPSGRMHINEDFVVLELDRSAPAFAGATAGPAPFIVTSLWSRGMPFIRYRNEDCGELLDEVCDCGNQFALLKLDIGRVNDNFTMPDGRIIHGLFFTYLMYGSQGIASFQFHQTAPDAITLWVVPTGSYGDVRERVVRNAVEKIRSLAAVPIRVAVCEVGEIPLTRAGKHRYTRSDVTVAGAAPAVTAEERVSA
jgi:phenylacetate-CoA ligase